MESGFSDMSYEFERWEHDLKIMKTYRSWNCGVSSTHARKQTTKWGLLMTQTVHTDCMVPQRVQHFIYQFVFLPKVRWKNVSHFQCLYIKYKATAGKLLSWQLVWIKLKKLEKRSKMKQFKVITIHSCVTSIHFDCNYSVIIHFYYLYINLFMYLTLLGLHLQPPSRFYQ